MPSTAQPNSERRLAPEQIHLRSDELQEVLGQPPSWVVRSGILMVAVFALILVIIAAYLEYPDTIAAPVKITTTVMPTSVEARVDGELERLFVEDEQTVEAGEPLAMLRNTVDYLAAVRLREWQANFEEQLAKDSLMEAILPEVAGTGELVNPLTNLRNALIAYQDFKTQDFLAQQRAQIQRQLATQDVLNQQLLTREELLEDDVELAKAFRQRSQQLRETGNISVEADQRSAKALLQDQLRLATIQEERSQLTLQRQMLQQTLQSLRQQEVNEEQQLLEDVRATFAAYRAALARWEERYLLSAPVAGQVAFYQRREVQQPVNEGEEVFILLPPTDSLVAYAQLSASNAGKVEQGQRVRIELADYPSKDFGYVFGEVEAKSDIIRDGKYWLTIRLPQGLYTKVVKERLPFSQEMIGQAEIVTDEQTLFQRLFRLVETQYRRWG